MSTLGRAKTIAVAAAVIGLALAVPADADVRRFTDARNDTSSSVDIRSVRVDNSTTSPNKVIVTVRQDNVRIGDSITIYLDTRPHDPGPEYSIGGAVASEFLMRHRERWKGSGRVVPFDCGYKLKIHQKDDRSRAVMPRSCLGDPGKVRVAVKVERGYPPASHDWAKARKTWFSWVHR